MSNQLDKPKIYPALIAAMREIAPIAKDKKNAHQGFMFRGIEQFMNAVHPLFAKHGIIIGTETGRVFREERQSKSGGLNIWTCIDCKFIFYAEDGSSLPTKVKGEAMDNGDKGTNKAIAVALKYALMNMFLVPTADLSDPDSETHEIAPKSETTRPVQKAPVPELHGQESRQPATEKQIQLIQSLVSKSSGLPKLGVEKIENSLAVGINKLEAQKAISWLMEQQSKSGGKSGSK